MAVWKHRGKWRAAYNRRHLGTFTRKRDAEQAVAEYRAGLTADTSTMTVAEWRTQWLGLVDVRDSTRRSYAEQTRAFAVEHGDRPLSSIDKLTASQWARSRRSTVRELHRMFRSAADHDLIPQSPFEHVAPPRYRRDLQPGWLTIDDVHRLADSAGRCAPSGLGPVLAAMVTTAAWTGVRPGELWALDPRDVQGARLHVRGAVDSGTGVVGPTKNGRPRVVVLPPAAAAAIDAMAPTIEFLFPGGHPGPLFPTLRGTRWRSPAFSFHWKTIRTTAGVRDGMAFYELRHFAATRLLEAGVAVEDVAHQLGHTDGGKLVVQVYGHPDTRFAEERIAAALGRLAEMDDQPPAPVVELPG